MALTDKQMRFVDEYMKDMNASAAYRRAGYTAEGNSAEAAASRLLRNVKVQDEIVKRQNKIQEESGITVKWVLSSFKEIAERCMTAVPVLDHEGEPTGEYRFDSNGANKALENIGRHLGMFKDKVEHGGSLVVFKGEDSLED